MKWRVEEIDLAFELKAAGANFAKIAARLPGRTADQVSNMFDRMKSGPLKTKAACRIMAGLGYLKPDPATLAAWDRHRTLEDAWTPTPNELILGDPPPWRSSLAGRSSSPA